MAYRSFFFSKMGQVDWLIDSFYFEFIIFSLCGEKLYKNFKVKNGRSIIHKYDTEKVIFLFKYDQIFK